MMGGFGQDIPNSYIQYVNAYRLNFGTVKYCARERQKSRNELEMGQLWIVLVINHKRMYCSLWVISVEPFRSILENKREVLGKITDYYQLSRLKRLFFVFRKWWLFNCYRVMLLETHLSMRVSQNSPTPLTIVYRVLLLVENHCWYMTESKAPISRSGKRSCLNLSGYRTIWTEMVLVFTSRSPARLEAVKIFLNQLTGWNFVG